MDVVKTIFGHGKWEAGKRGRGQLRREAQYETKRRSSWGAPEDQRKRSERFPEDLARIGSMVKAEAATWNTEYRSPIYTDIADLQDTFEIVRKLLKHVDILLNTCQNLKARISNTTEIRDNSQHAYGYIQNELLTWKKNAEQLRQQISDMSFEKRTTDYNYGVERNAMAQRIGELIQEINLLSQSRDADQRAHTENIKSRENEFSKRIGLLEDERRKEAIRHENEKRGMQKEFDVEKQQLLELHDAEKQEMRGKHEALTIEMEERHDSEVDRIKNRHDDEIGRKHREYEREAERIKLERTVENQRSEAAIRDLRQEVKSVTEEATKKSTEMHNVYESDIQAILAEKAGEIGELQQQIADAARQHKAKEDQMNAEWEESKARMVQDHLAEVARREQQYEDQVSELNASHAADRELCIQSVRHLKAEAVEYSQALLQRDIRAFDMLEIGTPKPLSDGEIETRFISLKGDVDSFARLKWKPNPEYWEDQLLDKLSPNQRILRKHILQDCIWELLYRFVFCSPFRILGPEGRILEAQWNEESGKRKSRTAAGDGEYVWPAPSPMTERWRYTTIIGCVDSLRARLPSEWDNRAKLKKSFKASTIALCETMESTLGDIVDLDDELRGGIGKLVRAAAQLWLDFGMQRYRIVFVMQGSNLESMEDRVRRANEGTLELVVTPMLKRCGNSDGIQFNVDEIIGAGNAETVKISTMGR